MSVFRLSQKHIFTPAVYIRLLSQALALRQQIRDTQADIERRKGLLSMGNLSSMAPAARNNFEDFITASQEKRKAIEEKLDTAIAHLTEADFWVLPSPDEYTTRINTVEPPEYYTALARRLEVAEARVRHWSELSTPIHQGTTTVAIGQEHIVDIDPLSSRPLKRRCPSPRGYLTEASTISDIMELLVHIETKATELEGETLTGERLAEKIEELLEPMWRASGLFKLNADLDRDDPTKSHSSVEEYSAVMHSTQFELTDSIMHRLDSELDILCDELANLSTTGAGLELRIGQLRVETEGLKETTARVSGTVQ